jgi:hypothetical protein
VEIVLATHGFASFGGSETYLLTVAEQLRRLGHGVTIHAAVAGEMAEHAAGRGLAVAVDEDELPDRCDVVLAQDSVMAYALADRWPGTPQVFRAPSDVHDFQLPPALPGPVAAVVVLSDRMARHVAALDAEHEVVRLHQPVDTARFAPRGDIAPRPRRAVLLGNYLTGTRRRALEDAWGIECVPIGLHGAASARPEDAIADADIVVGKARALLEGMACGRAAYLLDVAGGDGWVTPERYPAMEADNFAGQATGWALSPERLAADLADYRPEMGPVNRDLAQRHHRASDHAHALVALFRRVSPDARPIAAPRRELARVLALQWKAEGEAANLRRALAVRADELEHERARHDRTLQHAEWLDGRIEDLERQLSRLRRLVTTRRVRTALALGRAADRVRGR